jgi:hypothetical protein
MIILWNRFIQSDTIITNVFILLTICPSFADFMETIILSINTHKNRKYYEASQFTRFPQSPSLNPFVERLGTRWLSVLRFFVLRPPTCMIPSSPRSCETLLYIVPLHSNLCKLLHVNNVRTCIPEMQLFLIKME